MITALTGLPGGGKSLTGLWLMEQWWRAGCEIATNIRLTPECPFYEDVILLDDDKGEFPVFQLPIYSYESQVVGNWTVKVPHLVKPYRAFWHYMPPGVKYVIDEASNYWDSLDFAKLAEEGQDAKLYFKQHRKRHDDVVWIDQNPENVWNRIRRMTQSWWITEHTWRSRPLFQTVGLPVSWSSFIRTEFTSEEFSERNMVRSGYFTWKEAERMFGWYETDQIVGGADKYNWAGEEAGEHAVAG